MGAGLAWEKRAKLGLGSAEDADCELLEQRKFGRTFLLSQIGIFISSDRIDVVFHLGYSKLA